MLILKLDMELLVTHAYCIEFHYQHTRMNSIISFCCQSSKEEHFYEGNIIVLIYQDNFTIKINLET